MISCFVWNPPYITQPDCRTAEASITPNLLPKFALSIFAINLFYLTNRYKIYELSANIENDTYICTKIVILFRYAILY